MPPKDDFYKDDRVCKHCNHTYREHALAQERCPTNDAPTTFEPITVFSGNDFKYENKAPVGDHPRIPVTDKFIGRNKLELKRTDIETVARIRDAAEDFFGFEREVLANYLSKDAIINFTGLFKEEYVEKVKSGEESVEVPGLEESVQDFLDYMVFGWMKAMDERGNSASRSVSKLGAWLWLFGRDDLRRFIHDDDLYNPYGAPALIKVCEEMGIEVPDDLRSFAAVKCQA